MKWKILNSEPNNKRMQQTEIEGILEQAQLFILTKRPDLVLFNKEKRICWLEDISFI